VTLICLPELSINAAYLVKKSKVLYATGTFLQKVLEEFNSSNFKVDVGSFLVFTQKLQRKIIPYET